MYLNIKVFCLHVVKNKVYKANWGARYPEIFEGIKSTHKSLPILQINNLPKTHAPSKPYGSDNGPPWDRWIQPHLSLMFLLAPMNLSLTEKNCIDVAHATGVTLLKHAVGMHLLQNCMLRVYILLIFLFTLTLYILCIFHSYQMLF